MWQRWNQSTHIFEKSTDDGASWTPLGLNASIITEGTLSASVLPPLGNVAYKDQSNTFTVSPQILAPTSGTTELKIQSSVVPLISLIDSSQAVDARRFQIQNDGGLFKIWSTNDLGGGQSLTLSIDRSGNAVHSGTLWAKGAITSGPAQIALTAGDFMAARASNSGVLYLGSSGNVYLFRNTNEQVILQTAGPFIPNYYIFPGRADAPGASQTSWYISGHATWGIYSNASIATSGYFYDVGRTTAMGVWIDGGVPGYSGWTASTHYANQYMFLGNTMVWLCVQVGTVGAAASGIYLYIPAGQSNPTYQGGGIGQCLVGSTRINASWFSSPGNNFLTFVRNDGQLWPAGASINLQFHAVLRIS